MSNRWISRLFKYPNIRSRNRKISITFISSCDFPKDFLTVTVPVIEIRDLTSWDLRIIFGVARVQIFPTLVKTHYMLIHKNESSKSTCEALKFSFMIIVIKKKLIEYFHSFELVILLKWNFIIKSTIYYFFTWNSSYI